MTIKPDFLNFMCELLEGSENELKIREQMKALGFEYRWFNLAIDNPNRAPWFSYHFIDIDKKETYSAQYSCLGGAANLAARRALLGRHDDIEE